MPNPKVIIYFILTVIVSLFLYSAYAAVYNQGYAAAEHKYLLDKMSYQAEVSEKILGIESSLSTIANSNTIREDLITSDISEILRRLKKNPTVIIKEGKCAPTDTFINNINSAIIRANSK